MHHGDWVSHMVQKHWKSWNCPFCPSIACSSPAILQDHVSLQHPDEVPSNKLDSFIRLCDIADSSRCKGTCPLCSVFEIETYDQYQSHIGQHLEQLAASAFTDVPGERPSVGAKALIKLPSESHEGQSDAGPLLSKRPSTDQTPKSTHRSSKKQRNLVSPLASSSLPIFQPPQRPASTTVQGGIEQSKTLRISTSI